MPAERIHHTQQFMTGYETEGLNGERLNHHSIVHALGNYAITDMKPSAIKSFKIHSHELPAQPTKEEKEDFEKDRSEIVEAAFDARSTFKVDEPEETIDFSPFIDKDGYAAHTD